jgi:membrane-associated protease RseP (regulator of RpoE activity)
MEQTGRARSSRTSVVRRRPMRQGDGFWPMPTPETHIDEPLEEDPPVSGRVRTQLLLFAATLVSVFLAGAGMEGTPVDLRDPISIARALPHGWRFAVPVMAILLTHEFGHYFAARLHRVEASLPYFIPMPLVNPFGTMGAVIAMRGRIKSKNALLDIGASGPLAGLVVALPVLWYGLATSEVHPIAGPASLEGQNLLYLAMKRIILGPIPEGYDVFLNPIAFAGWTGLFVTALNLLPVGQLDGGHIAYSLFGARQNRYGALIHYGLLAIFAYNVIKFLGPVVLAGAWDGLGQAIGNSLFWLFWFGLLFLVRRIGGSDHPPTDPGELSPGRRVVAILSLALFVVLFMPTPWSTYG